MKTDIAQRLALMTQERREYITSYMVTHLIESGNLENARTLLLDRKFRRFIPKDKRLESDRMLRNAFDVC